MCACVRASLCVTLFLLCVCHLFLFEHSPLGSTVAFTDELYNGRFDSPKLLGGHPYAPRTQSRVARLALPSNCVIPHPESRLGDAFRAVRPLALPVYAWNSIPGEVDIHKLCRQAGPDPCCDPHHLRSLHSQKTSTRLT